MEKLTVIQNGISIPLKSLAEIRFKSPSIKSSPKNQTISIILNLISKTYFKCGQKTSEEELAALTNAFLEELDDYPYLTILELESVFKNGYKKVYGEYFGLNVKTFITWVDFYDKNVRHLELSKLRESEKEKPKTVSEKEKQFWINKGVTDCIEYFEEHREIQDGKTYVYSVLYDDGHLPTDVEYKKRVHKDALEVLDFEYKNKKPKSLAEKRQFKEVLETLYEKYNGKVIAKCHEIALAEFFRELTKDSENLEKFKEKYKNN